VDHAQTKEVGKNVELLKAVVENVKRQKVAREKSHERIRAVAGSSRRRLAGPGVVGHGLGGVSATGAGLVNGGRVNGGATGVIGVEGASRIGERGHLDVDELVKFIGGFGTGKAARGKNSLRGKRRTGAKR